MITTAPSEARKLCDAARADGRRVGFVPTMGALHEGHRSLMRRARRDDDVVCVSIFVNPTQFNESTDLAAYPRPFSDDLAACEAEGVDVVFAPTTEEMYPQPPLTRVLVDRIGEPMEGRHRPGHFDGVGLVCTKLFSIVGPCTAYFGDKDAQQLRIIRRVVADLDLPVEVVGCPTVREPDGLAMSSRNAYLSADERERATCLFRALREVERLVAAGRIEADELTRAGRAVLEEDADDVDYLEIVDPQTLEALGRIEGEALVCGAIRVGAARLIDNITVRTGGRPPEGEQA